MGFTDECQRRDFVKYPDRCILDRLFNKPAWIQDHRLNEKRPAGALLQSIAKPIGLGLDLRDWIALRLKAVIGAEAC